MFDKRCLIALLIVSLAACHTPPMSVTPTPADPTPAPATEVAPTATPATAPEAETPPGAGPRLSRPDALPLCFDDLMHGFDPDGPVDEAALTLPQGAAPPDHRFEGRLELLGEQAGGHIETLRGTLEPAHTYLPAFDFEFVQSDDGTLIPRQRGQIIAEHPLWNLILEPGRAWQEAGDGGFSRASFPFALITKGGNATFNGTLTFLFDAQSVSQVWYQVTQETTTYTRANLWGLLDAVYHPGPVDDAERLRADFAAERAARLPTKPIQALAEDYPGVDVSAFGRGVTPAHMTWYGVVVDGVNYVGGCQTRFGTTPYCESMRATSYSTAKSAFVSVALLRLAQKYGPVTDLLIKDYVPEYAASPGDWAHVTFNHALDMATGNYVSDAFMVDDNSQSMNTFFGAQPYRRRIAAAFRAPHVTAPGTRWVYRTSDTFILTRALHNYLQTQEGPKADIFQFVVDEVYGPLGLGPGAYTTMRTADDNWQGQAEGGYGTWWIPDDIAQLAVLLNNNAGKINGEQVLHPGLLAATLQRDPADRGVKIDDRQRYNNAFWATHYTPADGFACEFWVTEMQGVSGNVVALFPNGVTYYYFSDNGEFTWDAALRESDKIRPLCPP